MATPDSTDSAPAREVGTGTLQGVVTGHTSKPSKADVLYDTVTRALRDYRPRVVTPHLVNNVVLHIPLSFTVIFGVCMGGLACTILVLSYVVARAYALTN